jgi:hypothetical protein
MVRQAHHERNFIPFTQNPAPPFALSPRPPFSLSLSKGVAKIDKLTRLP